MKPSRPSASHRPLFLAAALLAGAAFFFNTLHSPARGQFDMNPHDQKTSYAVQAAFTDVVRRAGKSTVRLFAQRDGRTFPIILGTVISSDGLILTKASEILDVPHVYVKLANDSRKHDFKILGVSQTYDLALIKIDATGLTPIEFADTRPPETAAAAGPRRGYNFGPYVPRPTTPVVVPTIPDAAALPKGAISITVGEWVASADEAGTAGADLPPGYVGVISTVRRKIPPTGDARILGVVMDEKVPTKIDTVVPKSGAAAAGLKKDDQILAVDGHEITSVDDLRRFLGSYEVGDVVTVDLQRGSEKLSLHIVVGAPPDDADPEMEALSGDVSRRSANFPAVFQHDSLLEPQDCGGPLVDIEGHVIGINIARAGRTESYAIPADLIVADIPILKSGELAPAKSTLTKPAGK